MRLSLFLILVSEKLGFLSYKAEYVPDTYDHYHCIDVRGFAGNIFPKNILQEILSKLL